MIPIKNYSYTVIADVLQVFITDMNDNEFIPATIANCDNMFDYELDNLAQELIEEHNYILIELEWVMKKVYIVVYEYEDADGTRGVDFLGAYDKSHLAYAKMWDMEQTIIHNNTYDGKLWYDNRYENDKSICFSSDNDSSFEHVYIKEMMVKGVKEWELMRF